MQHDGPARGRLGFRPGNGLFAHRARARAQMARKFRGLSNREVCRARAHVTAVPEKLRSLTQFSSGFPEKIRPAVAFDGRRMACSPQFRRALASSTFCRSVPPEFGEPGVSQYFMKLSLLKCASHFAIGRHARTSNLESISGLVKVSRSFRCSSRIQKYCALKFRWMPQLRSSRAEWIDRKAGLWFNAGSARAATKVNTWKEKFGFEKK